MEDVLSRFEQTAKNVLRLMRDTLQARTFFIATTTKQRFKIVEVINTNDGCTIPSFVDEPLEKSYCSIVAKTATPLFIENTSLSYLVKNLEVTKEYSIGSYAGVPILLEDNTVFGTLCALDPMPYRVTLEDVEKLQSYALLISNAIELETVFRKLKTYEIQTKKELELARKVQNSVLSKDYEDEYLRIHNIFLPSSQLSGDLFFWFPIHEKKYGVLVLDVMGHGVSSALIGMSLKALIQLASTESICPKEMMKKLNTEFYRLFGDFEEVITYVTGIYLVIDVENMMVEYSNAGHPPGYLLIDKQLYPLEKGSLPLGLIKQISIESEQIPITETCEVMLYTDGLIDALKTESTSARQMITNHVEIAIQSKCSIVDYVKKELSAPHYEDDICFVHVEILATKR
ncbi:GAF domain-containing SpoIIE family protein phosphatase [Alkalihalobacterium bogoriense]|uniref:GAF domain-containing SpoIIE family protein phosphatase n=1 Tax=Alkalihalobacterium bogoriense TaxID=246272 RepID=UPI00047E91EC|nr:GAF domain-containing SpoIIE family protein phosphatase [Alkalihalobacterium bogoriense]